MKTKVRIAVAVDPDGKWCAFGSSGVDSWDVLVLDDLEDGEARYWVEAHVDIPERSRIVEGDVLCSECYAPHPSHNGLCSKLEAVVSSSRSCR